MARAPDWFTGDGVSVERILTDNGSPYRSHLWRDMLQGNDITHKRRSPCNRATAKWWVAG
jgi:transposase InsO family protein